MQEEQQRAAKGQMIALMQAGHSWQEAAMMAGVRVSRSTAYRLLQKVRTQGEAGLQDGRHGHPAKLLEPVLQWLKDYCRAAPSTPSHIVQQALANRLVLCSSSSDKIEGGSGISQERSVRDAEDSESTSSTR